MHKVIILGFPLLFVLSEVGLAGPRSLRGICEKVLDGDTIIVRGQRVRLQGIDAPETGQRSRDGRAIGKESTAFLDKLISGQKIEVVYSKRDKYGRILGKVFLRGKNINHLMLSSGYAVSYYAGRVEEILEYQAKLKRRGIFSSEGFYAPSYFRKMKN